MGKIKLGIYRHFKGKEYEVLYVAKHSETLEPMVVYKALYGERGIWVRPASMWNEIVEKDGKKFKRFEYIGNKILDGTKADTNARKFARRFWKAFNDYVFSNDNKFSQMFNKADTPPKENKYRLRCGTEAYHINLNFNTRDRVCKVRFVIIGYGRNVESSSELFDFLYNQKTQIEEAYGKVLQWKKENFEKIRFVEDSIPFNPEDSTTWNEAFQWYMDSAIKVNNIIARRLKNNLLCN